MGRERTDAARSSSGARGRACGPVDPSAILGEGASPSKREKEAPGTRAELFSAAPRTGRFQSLVKVGGTRVTGASPRWHGGTGSDLYY